MKSRHSTAKIWLVGIAILIATIIICIVVLIGGTNPDVLANELKLTRQAGIPLSISEAFDMGLIPPESEAQAKYEELFRYMEGNRPLKVVLDRESRAAIEIPTKFQSLTPIERSKRAAEFLFATKGLTRLYECAETASTFAIWNTKPKDTALELKNSLKLVGVVELLCASAYCEVVSGKRQRGLKLLNIAVSIGLHLSKQPFFFSQLPGSLILRCTYDAAKAMALTCPSDSELRQELLILASIQPEYPDPTLLFKVYMADSYYERFGHSSPHEDKENLSSAEMAEKIAWLRGIREAYIDVPSARATSISEYAIALRKHDRNMFIEITFYPFSFVTRSLFADSANILDGFTKGPSGTEYERKSLLSKLNEKL